MWELCSCAWTFWTYFVRGGGCYSIFSLHVYFQHDDNDHVEIKLSRCDTNFNSGFAVQEYGSPKFKIPPPPKKNYQTKHLSIYKIFLKVNGKWALTYFNNFINFSFECAQRVSVHWCY